MFDVRQREREAYLKKFRKILLEARETILAQMRKDGFWTTNIHRQNVRSFNPIVWDINNGWCAEFADEVKKHAPGSKSFWIAELEQDDDHEVIHVVIKAYDLYFDAECIDGVKHWRELPLYGNNPRPEPELTEPRKPIMY